MVTSSNPPADKDASLQLAFCYTEDALYLAGTALDDDFVTDDPSVWWASDAIEVFLDIDLEGDREVSSYNEDDFQVFLMPLNQGQKWGAYQYRGRRAQGHGDLPGIEVAAVVRRDEGSYDFEARLPFRGFGLNPRVTRRIGFNVALNDQDHRIKGAALEPAEQFYLSLNGAQGMSNDVSRLAILRFEGDPPSFASIHEEQRWRRLLQRTGAVLAILLAVGVLGYASRRFQEGIDQRFPRWRRWALVSLLGVVVALLVTPHVGDAYLDWRETRLLSERQVELADVLTRMAQHPALEPHLRSATTEELRDFLAGRPFQQKYRYDTLEIVDPSLAPGAYVSLDPTPGVPFLEYGILLERPAGGSSNPRLELVLARPEAASRVHLAVAALLPAATVGQLDGALEVIFHFDGGADSRHRFTLDDARSFPYHRSDTWGVAHMREGQSNPLLHGRIGDVPFHHLDHLIYDVPSNLHSGQDEARLSRVTLQLGDAAARATVFVSGITVERGLTHTDYRPLYLGSLDRDGIPMAIREGRRTPVEVALRPASKHAQVTLDLLQNDHPYLLDRLRLYYCVEGPIQRLSRGGTVEDRGLALVYLQDRERPLEFPLRAGIEVDEALLSESRHPDAMTSFIAATFKEGEQLLHYDGLDLDLSQKSGAPGPFAVTRIEVRNPRDAGGAFIVAGLTAGLRESLQPSQENPFSAETYQEERRLVSGMQDVLRAASSQPTFALLADGSVAALGPGFDPEIASRLKGVSLLGDGDGRDAEVAGVFRRELREGREFLMATVPVAPRERNFRVLLLHEMQGRAAFMRVRNVVATAAGLLLLPFVLLLLMDALTRVTRIRTRLSFLFLLTSAAPLTAIVVVSVKIIRADQQLVERERAKQIIDRARSRLSGLADRAQGHAARILGDLQASSHWFAPGNEDELQRQITAAAAAFGDPMASVQVRVEVQEPSGSTRIYYDDRQRVNDRRWDTPAAGLALSWNSVVFLGTAVDASGGIKVSVAGIVGEREISGLGIQPAEGESFSLLSPLLHAPGYEIEGGETLGGARLGERMPVGMAATAARVLDRGADVVYRTVSGVGTQAFDLLRAAKGEPVAMLGVTVEARPYLLDLGFVRIDLLWFVLLLGAVSLGCALFLGTLVTDGITRPLERLKRGAAALAAGESVVAVSAPGDDEVSELARSFNQMSADLRRRIRDQEVLAAATSCLTRTLDLRERSQVALDFLQEILGGQELRTYLYDQAEDALVLEGSHPEANRSAPARPARVPSPQGILRQALVDSKESWLAKPTDHESYARSSAEEKQVVRAHESVLLLPLGRARRSIGVIVVYPGEPENPSLAAEPTFLRNLIAQISVALENARLFRVAVKDPETGLFADSYFQDRLKAEIDRAALRGESLAVVLLQLQAQPGAEGSEGRSRLVLGLVRALFGVCRDRELVARSGPLSVEILISEGGAPRAGEICQQVAQRWGELQPGYPLLRGVRLEVAVASFPEDGPSRDFLWDALQGRLQDHPASASGTLGPELLARVQLAAPTLSFRSAAMREVIEQVAKVAVSTANVLILGETGTGKEVVARLIHDLSNRKGQPFVAVHCAALPRDLLEAELFGHEKGAFTGAERMRLGRFEEAQGGTIFLDEVAEIPLAVQVKLLRVLQERIVERLGSNATTPIDVRVVAATHRSLEQMVAEGSFREDLYYRLQVVSVSLAPLRDRLEEIPDLVNAFSREMASSSEPVVIEPAALDRLRQHRWPGNIRELRNVIQRALVLGDGREIRRADISWGDSESTTAEAPGSRALGPGSEEPSGLADRQRLLLDLFRRQGRVTSREYLEAAGVSRRTALRDLQELMRQGLVRREGSRKAAVYRLSTE